VVSLGVEVGAVDEAADAGSLVCEVVAADVDALDEEAVP
jgi:hypothetical protein